ncbi:MAG: biotin/lipoyl-binding protein [Myxococcales bacterium]|nr:biotin/lipoyl-binding protein [Myxococcales bacterium]
MATVLGAPLLGVLMTPKRENVAKAEEAQTEAVTSATAAAKPIPTSDFVGVLLSQQMATISSYADSRVMSLEVKVGQRIHKGQKLVVLDPRSTQQELEGAKGALAAAGGQAGAAAAEARFASQRANRRNETIDLGGGRKMSLVSGEDQGQALSDRAAAAGRAASAAGSMAQARARIKQLELALENMEPMAPFDGVVQQIMVETGTTIHNGQPLVRLVGGQGLRAKIAIPEEAAGVWQGRRRAQLDVDIQGQTRTFWAVIDQVAPEVEPASRSFFIEGPVPVTPEMCGGDCVMLGGRPVKASLISDKE